MDSEKQRSSSRLTSVRLMEDRASIVDAMEKSDNPAAVIKAMTSWEERVAASTPETQACIREVHGAMGEKIFERYRRENSPEGTQRS